MPGLPIPDKFFDKLTNMFKSLKTEGKGKDVTVGMLVPSDLGNGFSLLPFLMVTRVGQAQAVPAQPQAVPVQPPPVKEKIEAPKKDTGKEATKKEPKDTKKESRRLLLPGQPIAWRPANLERLTLRPEVIACRHENAT
jgi:hypothetical protein